MRYNALFKYTVAHSHAYLFAGEPVRGFVVSPILWGYRYACCGQLTAAARYQVHQMLS